MNTSAGRIVREDAWSEFWADRAQSHCVAGDAAIRQILAAHWVSFAACLPPGATVLDLGCGAGVVGSWMLGARRDLRISGVDSARIRRQLHPRLDLRAETTMEALPFVDQRFGAVVSQFGFEYGQRSAAAHEIARILSPGGALSLIVHHAGSVVMATNRVRAAVLASLLSAPVCNAFCDGDAAALHGFFAALLEQYARDELLSGVAQSLPRRLSEPGENRAAIWTALEQALAPEHCVVQALIESCVAEAQLDQWLEPLRVVCAVPTVSVLREPDGKPIAWRIEGSRVEPRD